MNTVCGNCLFFSLGTGSGKCRRFPPKGVNEELPSVQPSGWCGEWTAADPPTARKIDASRAEAEDWSQLPYITPEEVDLLVRLRRGGVELTHLELVAQVLGLSSAHIELWRPHLTFPTRESQSG